MAKDPDHRYKNCAEFAADLRAVSGEVRRPSFEIKSVSLPSEIRTEPVGPLPPVPVMSSTITRPIPPPDEDPAEWYLSEMLRLLPAFEEKINCGDVPGARAVLERLEAIESADGRFGEALLNCRTRFSEANAKVPAADVVIDPTIPEPPPIQPKPSPQPQRPSKKCPFCEATNRLAAANCIECGAPFESLKSEPQRQPNSADDETKIFGNASLPVSQAVENNLNSWFLPAIAKCKALVNFKHARSPLPVAIVTTIVTLLLALVIWSFWPVSVKPAVATARVAAWRSAIYRDTSKSDLIEVLNHGQPIHILTLPHSREQEWVQAQIVDSTHKTPPGFVLARDLGGWDSTNPDSALSLFLIFQPREGSATKDVESSIGQFSRWLGQHGQSTSAPKAHLALAELYILLGRSEIDSTENLRLAEFQIKLAEADQSLKGRTEALAKEVTDLSRK